jgi:4-hydroxybenzoyl-CoA reductase subunit beta
MLNGTSYLRPSSIEEAAALLERSERDGEESVAFFAGGSDFVPLLKLRLKAPRYLALLSGIAELKDIRVEGDTVVLGACATLTDIAEHPALLCAVPSLCEAALAVGSPQIRNTGTVGGNLFQDRRCLYFNQSESWRSAIEPCFKTGGWVCHQIPRAAVCQAFYYSDMATALLSLGATAALYTAAGVRRLPLEETLAEHLASNGGQGGQKYSRALLTEVRFSVPRFSCFTKFAGRASFDFPLLNFSAAKYEAGWRAFSGGWGTRPVRLAGTEEALNGKKTPEETGRILLKELKDRHEMVREAGLSPRVREKLPLSKLFLDIRAGMASQGHIRDVLRHEFL